MRSIWLLVLISAGATSAAADTTARVSRRVCDRLVPHEAAPDVRYQAGVDARGRPVVPADVDGGQLALPPMLGMDLLVPWPVPAGPDRPAPFRGDLYVGTVTIGSDGTVLLDGRPLLPREQAYIAAECRKAALR